MIRSQVCYPITPRRHLSTPEGTRTHIFIQLLISGSEDQGDTGVLYVKEQKQKTPFKSNGVSA